MIKLLPSLNGLRAFSIMCVLFSHSLGKNFGKSDAPGGQIGVTIFFVISGYLITLLLLQEEKKNGHISLRNFYIRRTLRIFPAYYFLLLVYLLLQLNHVLYFSPLSWLTSLTYTKYFDIADGKEWESGHFWSLSVEEHFYLIWPLIFKFLPRVRTKFAFGIVTLVIGCRLFSMFDAHNIFIRADALMIGALSALFDKKMLAAIRYVGVLNRAWLLVPFIGIIICILFKRVFHLEDTPLLLTFLGSYGLLTNICVIFIIMISITFKNNLWFQFLNSKIVNQLGLLSYSIYLWQQIFFSSHVGLFSRFPINLIFILLAAISSFYLIEKPFLTLKNRYTAKRQLKLTSEVD